MITKVDFGFDDVVLVADIFVPSASNRQLHSRRDLEMTDLQVLDDILSAIKVLGLKVHHYKSPAALGRNAWRHKRDIVLALYGGQSSRSRMALVPAICEAYGLRFVGPDAYGRIIAQDKEISKRLALDCGLRTPSWRVVRSVSDLEKAVHLAFPVVVKPLAEGSSIGISQASRVLSSQDAVRVATEMLQEFSQPVLVEEFVSGREVAYTRIQGASEPIWAFSEIAVKGQPGFFEERLFDAHEKQNRTLGRTVRNIDAELTPDDKATIETFLDAFGPYGYCRVDGRLAEGRFWLIELTPDAWLGPSGQFTMSFTEKGWSYPDVIAAILASAG